MSSYRVAPIFLIRLAGVPFEVLEELSTSKTAQAARTLMFKERALSKAAQIAENLLSSRSNQLPEELFKLFRSAVRNRRTLKLDLNPQFPAEFSDYCKAALQAAEAKEQFANLIEAEVAVARVALLRSARGILPRYFVFAAAGARDLLEASAEATAVAAAPRNKRARERERHLLLYLQRIAAKNDTFSEFGPAAWGKTSISVRGMSVSSGGTITNREAFLERWAAQTIVDAINSDPETRPEIAPRLNPSGSITKNGLILDDSQEPIRLSANTLKLLERCDGKTPAHSLDASLDEVGLLADRSILLWQLEVPAMEPYVAARLEEDVRGWRDTAVRARWLSIIKDLIESASSFTTADINQRQHVMTIVRDRLHGLGATEKPTRRSLYSAVNPIAEECFKNSNFTLGEDLIDEVATSGAPWIDLWRDTYAFVAGEVNAGLRNLFASASRRGSVLTLPAFLKHCASERMSLTGPGLVVLAATAFYKVKERVTRRLEAHRDQSSYQLTADDCRVIREAFDFDRFDEYTYPSADLQLAAKTRDAIENGDYQWVLGELHPPVAILHHGGYWSCPDPAGLSASLKQTVFDQPNLHFGIFVADFTAHTTVHLFDALPDLTYFVAPQRGNPKWQTVRPADAEVFIDDSTGDVGVRTIDSHKFLGSFARNWIIPLGFHPFHFGMSPHSPRLMCGNVVVQRRAWTVREEELRPGSFNGISRDLVLAIEELRAARDLPRYVYIRPTEQALRRSGAEGRDKDTKPVFIDLESYLFLEIFHRWLKKAGEIEVTEMLPDPDHLCWQEADGRRTFELRTLIVPRT